MHKNHYYCLHHGVRSCRNVYESPRFMKKTCTDLCPKCPRTYEKTSTKLLKSSILDISATPGWLSGERVGLMKWWL